MFRGRIFAAFVLLLPSAEVLAQSANSSTSCRAGSPDQNQSQRRPCDLENNGLMTRLTPHPYLYVGPSLMPAGYRIAAVRFEGGLDVESTRVLVQVGAAYDNARAAHDAGQQAPSSHDYYLDGVIAYRPEWPFSGRGFVGIGERWSQFSTTNYTTTAHRPQFGGGFDLVRASYPTREFSMRIAANWFTAGNDWRDGNHGVEASLSIPSLRKTGHWFYQERIGVYSFHSTVTDRTKIPLAPSQRAERSLTSYVDFGILYRF